MTLSRKQFVWEVRTFNLESSSNGPIEKVRSYWSPDADGTEAAIGQCGAIAATRRTGRQHEAASVTLIG